MVYSSVTNDPRVDDVDPCKYTVFYVDIDGVLADIQHRLTHKDKKDYDAFYGLTMADDEPDQCGINFVEALIKGYQHGIVENTKIVVVLVTGRPERTRSITELWLQANTPALYDQMNNMLMREDGDHRSSEIVKTELISQYIAEEDLIMDAEHWFIDDDPKNINYVTEKINEGYDGDIIFEGVVYSNRRLTSSEQSKPSSKAS